VDRQYFVPGGSRLTEIHTLQEIDAAEGRTSHELFQSDRTSADKPQWQAVTELIVRL
jgi:hypothetical protein